MGKYLAVSVSVVFFLLGADPAWTQTWEFVKKTDGISLYVSRHGNSALKSFRGEVEFKGDFAKACSLVGDPSNLAWWGNDVKNIQVLYYSKGVRIKYYLVYDVPWPFTDRDLAADVRLTEDSVSGTKTVYSKPLLERAPWNPKLIHVKDFWQKWTFQTVKNGMIRITLEGFVDPAGSVPAWVYNLVVIEKPLKLLKEIRRRTQMK